MSEGEGREAAAGLRGFGQRLASYWTIELNVAVLFLFLYLNFHAWNRNFGWGCIFISGGVFLYWAGRTAARLCAPASFRARCPGCGRKMAYVDNMARRCPYCAADLFPPPDKGQAAG